MKIASLFAGCGGLDLGFVQAGFDIVWSNEYDKTIYPTHHLNFPDTQLDARSITHIPIGDIPDVEGIIGGPPCQSWSEAGSKRGIEDARGKLFHEYIRILEGKKPKFFLAENVSGILHKRHAEAFSNILRMFEDSGYDVSYQLLNAYNFGVPQDRHRVIIVGFHKDLGKKFIFPKSLDTQLTLKDAIYDLKEYAIPALDKNKANNDLKISNQEYMTGSFSTIFMSRNRVRTWDEPSFTIQAGGRHAPIHPQAPKMVKVAPDQFEFVRGYEYRRMTVRECARVQTFPDNFIFKYNTIADGYKMVGNAVPVNFANYLAKAIAEQISL